MGLKAKSGLGLGAGSGLGLGLGHGHAYAAAAGATVLGTTLLIAAGVLPVVGLVGLARRKKKEAKA